jgi:D-threo-aldose 1-dehydrogenase
VSFDPACTRAIGRRDVAVSQLGVGTAPFGSFAAADSDASIGGTFAQLHVAGLRYFDTAPFYGLGLAEHRLGGCLRSVDRRSLTLSTKVGRLMKPVGGGAKQGVSSGASPFEVAFDYSYEGTLRSLEHSLQRLQTNSVDIVLIHDVNRRWQADLVEQRYREAMDGAHRALHELRAQGVIKAFGVGVNDWSILLRFAADGDFDCFMLAGRYTLLDHSAVDSFMPDCERRGISVLMAAPSIQEFSQRARKRAPRSSMSKPKRRLLRAPAGSKPFASATASRSRPPRCNFRLRILPSPAW